MNKIAYINIRDIRAGIFTYEENATYTYVATCVLNMVSLKLFAAKFLSINTILDHQPYNITS